MIREGDANIKDLSPDTIFDYITEKISEIDYNILLTVVNVLNMFALRGLDKSKSIISQKQNLIFITCEAATPPTTKEPKSGALAPQSPFKPFVIMSQDHGFEMSMVKEIDQSLYSDIIFITPKKTQV